MLNMTALVVPSAAPQDMPSAFGISASNRVAGRESLRCICARARVSEEGVASVGGEGGAHLCHEDLA